jgi:hypothetical protein
VCEGQRQIVCVYERIRGSKTGGPKADPYRYRGVIQSQRQNLLFHSWNVFWKSFMFLKTPWHVHILRCVLGQELKLQPGEHHAQLTSVVVSIAPA